MFSLCVSVSSSLKNKTKQYFIQRKAQHRFVILDNGVNINLDKNYKIYSSQCSVNVCFFPLNRFHLFAEASSELHALMWTRWIVSRESHPVQAHLFIDPFITSSSLRASRREKMQTFPDPPHHSHSHDKVRCCNT